MIPEDQHFLKEAWLVLRVTNYVKQCPSSLLIANRPFEIVTHTHSQTPSQTQVAYELKYNVSSYLLTRPNMA